MKDFLFESKFNSDFDTRVKNSFKEEIFVLLFLFIVAIFLGGFLIAVGLIISLLVLQYFEFKSWERYYIVKLLINGDNVSIKYKDKDENKIIDGNINDFIFKKSRIWYKFKSKVPYLAVYYKGNLIMRQFENGDWKEDVFTKITEN